MAGGEPPNRAFFRCLLTGSTVLMGSTEVDLESDDPGRHNDSEDDIEWRGMRARGCFFDSNILETLPHILLPSPFPFSL
jgi:hypothetical protein